METLLLSNSFTKGVIWSINDAFAWWEDLRVEITEVEKGTMTFFSSMSQISVTAVQNIEHLPKLRLPIIYRTSIGLKSFNLCHRNHSNQTRKCGRAQLYIHGWKLQWTFKMEKITAFVNHKLEQVASHWEIWVIYVTPHEPDLTSTY